MNNTSRVLSLNIDLSGNAYTDMHIPFPVNRLSTITISPLISTDAANKFPDDDLYILHCERLSDNPFAIADPIGVFTAKFPILFYDPPVNINGRYHFYLTSARTGEKITGIPGVICMHIVFD